MQIKTSLELSIGVEEHDQVVMDIVKAIAGKVREMGKTDFADFSEEDIKSVAAACFQVSVAAVFNGGLEVQPPYSVEVTRDIM